MVSVPQAPINWPLSYPSDSLRLHSARIGCVDRRFWSRTQVIILLAL